MPIIAPRETIAWDLREFGEDKVASKLLEISDQDYRKIGERAFYYACQPANPANPNSKGIMMAKACALAAVEVIEGAPRPLRWKRRKSLRG